MTFLTFCTKPRGFCLPWCWPPFPQMPWPWLLYGSVALSHALILWLNSHLSLPLMHHAASISFYPSCLALSSLVSSCLILPISCPCYLYLFPSPLPPSLPCHLLLYSSHTFSLSSSLLSAVEVRYDAKPESQPVFNYINKTPCEVEWPPTPQPSLSLPPSLLPPPPLQGPHPSPFHLLSFPVSPSLSVFFCRLRSVEAPCRPSPIGARLHFMADCEACVSPSPASVPPSISSGSWHIHFTGDHVRDFSHPPWPDAGVGRIVEHAGKMRPLSKQS